MRTSSLALFVLLCAAILASASAQYLTVPSRYPGIGLGNPKCVAPPLDSPRLSCTLTEFLRYHLPLSHPQGARGLRRVPRTACQE